MFDEKTIEDVKALGISAAAYFKVAESEFVFDKRYRELCEVNTCGAYGKNYMCPPALGSYDDCVSEILRFEHALIISTIHQLEDSFDYEGMQEGGRIHGANVYKIWDYLKENRDNLSYSELKVLGAGGCSVCSKCGIIDDVPCRFPEKAIAPVEGHGIDVAHLTTSHGLNYINGENTVTYVALYLLK